MDELIRKYEVQSEVLLRLIQHPKSTEDEIERAEIARRFTKGMMEDLIRANKWHKEQMKAFGDYCRTGILNIDYGVEKLDDHLNDFYNLTIDDDKKDG